MHIIIAPNSFKNSLNALEAGKVIQKGLGLSKLNASYEVLPIADGGDYTLEILVDYFKGKYIDMEVEDPLGRQIKASYGLIKNGKVAVIEYTKASGIHLLNEDELNPLKASSYGTGKLISDALDKNVEEIWLGVGGSATVEAGIGILEALGIKLLNKEGYTISRGARGLYELETIDTSKVNKKALNIRLKVLCDVDNYLLGEQGAAKIFGPQKGADEKMVIELENLLTKFRNITQKTIQEDMADIKHGGASGGIPATLKVYLNAKLVNGIDFILDQMNFNKSLHKADLLITAEGKIDNQTLGGKGPAGVALKAKEKNIPVIALGGKIPDKIEQDNLFDAVFSILPGPVSLATALENTRNDLERTACQLGNLLSLSMK